MPHARVSRLADALDVLIAAAIAVGRNQVTHPEFVDRMTVEICRRDVLLLAVPDAIWLKDPAA
jgi:hypothetical protein